ncbi:isoprenylcysteine carboxylmethyltransferase family protein [Fulvivirga sp. 29W222]|uniref:Isoprenylcysteine carboxylmethyltransferase family protein n=1 Tax=Fulvivirga marina TaxID=2494733 RepID=A0A937KEF8_9BACT|nr:isoprenylcysteine carboxylmethyltransferase family protein [Fulvivirga marina]MBL6449702.1 isoprenylcysteine carboxylmethyltransferase family protein [Fulvivirga marina]
MLNSYLNPMEGIEAYIFLAFGWLIFFFCHSLFASRSSKEKLQKSFNISSKTYRLLYNTSSIVVLLAILLLNGAIKGDRLLPPSSFLQYISLLLAGGGVVVIRVAFREFDFKSFMGLSREDPASLNRSGILGYVRHPIYSGTVLLVLGFLLYDFRMPTLVSAICIFVYLPVGIWYEEQKLIKIFGDEYLEYKKTTPAIFPKIRFWF